MPYVTESQPLSLVKVLRTDDKIEVWHFRTSSDMCMDFLCRAVSPSQTFVKSVRFLLVVDEVAWKAKWLVVLGLWNTSCLKRGRVVSADMFLQVKMDK